jgi:hypothetical protein
VEWCAGIEELRELELAPQSFARLLTSNAPTAVQEKLSRWGVSDYISIFSRAIGLHAIFTAPPGLDQLTDEFLRNYSRYADALYRGYLETEPHPTITAENFCFDLYASGEYSQMLESQWAE